MKHFSPAMFGFASDEAIAAEDAVTEERRYAAACRSYGRYLKRIAPSCPAGVRKFIALDMHDARFVSTSTPGTGSMFACRFNCNAVTQPAPKHVRLEFEGVDTWVGPKPQTGDEWLYEELEQLDVEKFRITLIFWRPRARRVNRRKLCEWQFSNVRCDVTR